MRFLVFTLLVTFSVAIAGDLPCNCRLGALKRIINGEIATSHSIPWIVSLSTFSDHFCTATILNEKYILTAAHCVLDLSYEQIFVEVGMQNSMDVDFERTHHVKNIIKTDFKNAYDIGDFALIELEDPISFVPGEIEPACLNLDDKDFDGDLLSAGWGLTDRSWVYTNNLDGELNLPEKSTNELKYFFSTQSKSQCEDHYICIKPKNEGDSVCNGDSGGPLMHTKNGKTSVVGITSFDSGKREGDKVFFCNGGGYYARVSLHKNLIDQHVQNYCTA